LSNNDQSHIDRWGNQRTVKPAGARLWGDGLVERSLSTVYYPCTWEDVSEDELAFLLPSLCNWPTASASAGIGPVYFLRRALLARIHDFAQRTAALAHDDRSAKWPDVYAAISRSGVVSTIANEVNRGDGQSEWDELYRTGRFVRHRARTTDNGEIYESPRDFTLFELYVISCLDRILHDAIARTQADPPPATSDFRLSDALTVTIYSSFNAAYVYPGLACSHELLTVGAWLGYLVRGRTALMPPFIAERLLDYLSDGAPDETTDSGLCIALLRFHAEMAARVSRLQKKAKQVYKAGLPLTVRPSRSWELGPVRPEVWDDARSRTIAARIGLGRDPLEVN
jgi:hypothetical protein